jgi:hypothetical protein
MASHASPSTPSTPSLLRPTGLRLRGDATRSEFTHLNRWYTFRSAGEEQGFQRLMFMRSYPFVECVLGAFAIVRILGVIRSYALNVGIPGTVILELVQLGQVVVGAALLTGLRRVTVMPTAAAQPLESTGGSQSGYETPGTASAGASQQAPPQASDVAPRPTAAVAMLPPPPAAAVQPSTMLDGGPGPHVAGSPRSSASGATAVTSPAVQRIPHPLPPSRSAAIGSRVVRSGAWGYVFFYLALAQTSVSTASGWILCTRASAGKVQACQTFATDIPLTSVLSPFLAAAAVSAVANTVVNATVMPVLTLAPLFVLLGV